MNTCCVAKSTKAITYLLFRQRRSKAEGFAGLGVKTSPDCNTLAVEGVSGLVKPSSCCLIFQFLWHLFCLKGGVLSI
jgi:hypothetical protein